MKKTGIFLLCLLLCLLSACGNNTAPKSTEAPAGFDPQAFHWESQIRADNYGESTALMKALSDAVEISSCEAAGMDAIHVMVSAPNIADALLAWLEQVPMEELTEKALEDKALALLKSAAKETVDFTLNYALENDAPVIQYTAEFGSFITCGMTEFYSTLMDNLLAEMGEEIK